MKSIKIFLIQMKQTIKNYLDLLLAIITLFVIFSIGLFPIIYLDNVLAILYFAILYPIITLGLYKVVIILYIRINKLLKK